MYEYLSRDLAVVVVVVVVVQNKSLLDGWLDTSGPITISVSPVTSWLKTE